MTGSPLARDALSGEAAAFLTERFGDLPPEGLSALGDAFADYLMQSVQGSAQGMQAVMWALFSAAYAGRYPQDVIDAFFKEVSVDPSATFRAWNAAREDGSDSFSLVLLPGKLADGDVAQIAKSLFMQQRDKSAG